MPATKTILNMMFLSSNLSNALSFADILNYLAPPSPEKMAHPRYMVPDKDNFVNQHKNEELAAPLSTGNGDDDPFWDELALAKLYVPGTDLDYETALDPYAYGSSDPYGNELMNVQNNYLNSVFELERLGQELKKGWDDEKDSQVTSNNDENIGELEIEPWLLADQQMAGWDDFMNSHSPSNFLMKKRSFLDTMAKNFKIKYLGQKEEPKSRSDNPDSFENHDIYDSHKRKRSNNFYKSFGGSYNLAKREATRPLISKQSFRLFNGEPRLVKNKNGKKYFPERDREKNSLNFIPFMESTEGDHANTEVFRGLEGLTFGNVMLGKDGMFYKV